MDLETFLVSLYAMVDEWWKRLHPRPLRRAGHPPSLSEVEVLTLAILAQWPRWKSERDFWRFADLYLRGYFPNLLSQSQLNRRIRALEPEVRALQRNLAESLAKPSEVYHVACRTEAADGTVMGPRWQAPIRSLPPVFSQYRNSGWVP